MIRLYQFRRAWGTPNPSPFCTKVECFLRMTKLDYEPVFIDNPAKGPKGKAPWIEDGEVRIGDSTLILDYLERRHGADLDAELTADQRAVSHAVSVMLDEHLYWTVLYSRWGDDDFWPEVRATFFGALPAPLRGVVPAIARRRVLDQLRKHGMGRHTPAEIYEFGRRDIAALAALLGDRPYLHGERPTRADASVYAYISCIHVPPFDSPLKQEVAKHPALIAHCERMREAYFADL